MYSGLHMLYNCIFIIAGLTTVVCVEVADVTTISTNQLITAGIGIGVTVSIGFLVWVSTYNFQQFQVSPFND